jgi:hypothetical protein
MHTRVRTINELGFGYWFIVIACSIATAIGLGLIIGWITSTF